MEPGLEATIEERVTEEMTAVSLGSGDVPVLGTPAVLALAERACRASIEGTLPGGRTSVGSWVELSHLAPTPVGAMVIVRATLTEADDRTLVFEFSASDGSGQIARGTHRRVVVDRDRFLEHAHER